MLCRGWVPDTLTVRDAFSLGADPSVMFPKQPESSVSIADATTLPPYKTSLSFHACAATAVAAAIQLSCRREHRQEQHLQPSIRFLYYTGRYLQFRERENGGASIYATLRASQVIGFCREDQFPVGDGDWNEPPSRELYLEAERWGVAKFCRLSRGQELFERVLSNGYPFLFGAYIERRFLTSGATHFGLPTTPPADRHCMLAVGYDDGWFKVRDSINRGPNDQDPGYVYISYAYFDEKAFLTDDFWVITDVVDAHETLEGGGTLRELRDRYVDAGRVFGSMVRSGYDEARPRRAVPVRSPMPPIAEKIPRRSGATTRSDTVRGGRLAGLFEGTTAKRFTHGAHRTLDPVDFMPRVERHLALAGVTRMANITGLDRTGIPCYSAVRPRGVTLSVVSGKGVTHEAAMVSAAMEAIEVFSAETIDLPQILSTQTEVGRTHVSPTLFDLPLRQHALVRPDSPVRWTFGSDLITGSEAAIPVDLITLGQPADLTSPFHQTSNGLASGAVDVEAVLVALLEVVEHDAVVCSQIAAKKAHRPLPRVRTETLSDMPLAAELLARLRAVRIEPIIYDCTVDTRIPVYFVRVIDAERRFVGVFFGSGAHLDPQIALVRALTEAAQSRAVYASGTRDDLLGRELAQAQAQDCRPVIAALVNQPATVDARNATSLATTTFESDIRRVLSCIAAAGIEHAFLVDLTPESFQNELVVVRAVVPGLAGPGVERGLPSLRAETIARRLVA